MTVAQKSGKLAQAKRIAAGLSVSDIARALKLPDASQVSKLERGKGVSLEKLDAVARAIGVSLKELVP